MTSPTEAIVHHDADAVTTRSNGGRDRSGNAAAPASSRHDRDVAHLTPAPPAARAEAAPATERSSPQTTRRAPHEPTTGSGRRTAAGATTGSAGRPEPIAPLIVQRAADPDADPEVLARATATSIETPAPPAASLGDRFLHELSRQPAPAPQPLPERFRPMAQAITGHHRIMLSINESSRRALRSVGKVAATTDNVIHLDAPLAPGRRTTEVLAHELTHVAHPSPAPRFFDDDHRSPEERTAERVAEVMARAPLAPSGTISRARDLAAPAVSRAAPADGTVQRSPAPSGTGTISAAALASRLSGGPKIQRTPHAPATSISSDPTPDTVRRFDSGTRPSTSSSTGDTVTERDVQNDFRAQLDLHFEYLLRRLESRMVIELERRGGRFWRGI